MTEIFISSPDGSNAQSHSTKVAMNRLPGISSRIKKLELPLTETKAPESSSCIKTNYPQAGSPNLASKHAKPPRLAIPSSTLSFLANLKNTRATPGLLLPLLKRLMNPRISLLAKSLLKNLSKTMINFLKELPSKTLSPTLESQSMIRIAWHQKMKAEPSQRKKSLSLIPRA